MFSKLRHYSIRFSLVFISFYFLGCQTAPVRYENVAEGSWQAKLLVRDKVKSKSVLVNIDIKARAFKQLRIDATSAIGGHLAALVLSGEDVSYIMVRQKSYFKGRANGRSLSRVLGIRMDPKLLYNMLFDRAPEDKNWVCKKDKNDFLLECQNLKTQDKITWKNRENARKLVQLENKKGLLQMNLRGFEAKIKQSPQTFKLKIPKSFKRIRG